MNTYMLFSTINESTVVTLLDQLFNDTIKKLSIYSFVCCENHIKSVMQQWSKIELLMRSTEGWEL